MNTVEGLLLKSDQPVSTMSEPQIGIVVPTLNSSLTLAWTLCALRSQRNVSLEIIVADSGSEDGTLDICKRWGVPAIYVPPGNMYRAINAGLRQLGTEWVTYLNSDDLVYPHSYARMLTLGEQQRASVVYGECDFLDEEGRFLYELKAPPPSRLPGMFRRGRLGFKQAAAIFRKTAFQELGGFDERYRLISDYDFFYRTTFSGYVHAHLRGPAVAAFRLHSSQLSEREAANMSEEMRLFQEAQNVKASFGDLFDVLYWRLQNSATYVWRLARQRP
jgi:glycosyltransferase involved in cell wall biosynthesis